MPRNVEVKARVHDLEAVKQRVLDLKTASVADDDDCNNDVGDDNVVVSVVMKQEDDFYNLPADRPGKLKLRKVKGICSELIYYDREESSGPKLSSYNKCQVPESMEVMLKNALGLWGQVKKIRTLIMIGQTRVHFDSVEDLGDFVELEVVLNDDQTVEDGKTIATELLSHMGVEEKDLVPVSYVNLLCQKNKSMS